MPGWKTPTRPSGPTDPRQRNSGLLQSNPQRSAVLSIQPPYSQIQIPRKGHPQQIGQLEPPGQGIHLGKGVDHPQDQPPQDHQPQQRRAPPAQAEEQDGPQGVGPQLAEEGGQRPLPYLLWVTFAGYLNLGRPPWAGSGAAGAGRQAPPCHPGSARQTARPRPPSAPPRAKCAKFVSRSITQYQGYAALGSFIPDRLTHKRENAPLLVAEAGRYVCTLI